MPLLLSLVPKTAWGQNLRSRYPNHWDAIRRATYARANWRCECCGDRGRQEAHEAWKYLAPLKEGGMPRQKLVSMISLCRLCHAAQHRGLSEIQGIAVEVDAHMMALNGWSREQLDEHLEQAFEIWRARSQANWELDTSVLDAMVVQMEAEEARPGSRAPLPNAVRMVPGAVVGSRVVTG